MDNEQLLRSLAKWLQTFNVSAACGTAEELSDGVAMAQVLSKVSPDYFDSSWLTKIKSDTSTNWRLKVSNLKKILKGVVEYYTEVLGHHIGDFQLPDVNAIGEHKNAVELGRLVQLILGCAVNCDHKQEYIEAIMGMQEADQHVVMSLIQELMTKEAQNAVHHEGYTENDKLKQLINELQLMTETKEQIEQRLHELDSQMAGLSEENQNLIAENKELREKLAQAEGLDDLSSSSSASRQTQNWHHQIDELQEELYKMESARDEYRLRVEELEREKREILEKNEELQRFSDEARLLKDEVDVLRETSDKVAKYESVIESYKKKLEDLGNVKRQLKLSEEKNNEYVQQNMELEEELKKTVTLRSQLDLHKNKLKELNLRLTEETKKADKAEFERKKLQEKLTALEREKERLVVERDTLRETNEELKLTQLHIVSTSSYDLTGPPSASGAGAEAFEMIPPLLKEKLIRLEHENKMLKLNRQVSDEDQIQVLQTMLDDSKERQSELETENRLVNQRVLELESQLEEFQANQSSVKRQEGAELRQKLSSMTAKIKDLETELKKKSNEIDQHEGLVQAKNAELQQFQEIINKKDDEIREMDERYKKYLDKAKSVMLTMDNKQNVTSLKTQLQEKEKVIKSLEKESKESRAMREMEEKLIITAMHNLGMQLQRHVVEDRLSQSVAGSKQSLLARQRQAPSRRVGLELGHSDNFVL